MSQQIIEAEYFGLQELLPKEIYMHLKNYNSLWKGWLLFPEETIITIDSLRKQFGPMYINTWALDAGVQAKHGLWNGRGYRDLNLEKKPNYVSLHCAGMATDSSFDNVTAEEARKFILENPDKFPFINCLEMTLKGEPIGWLHWDKRPIKNRIYKLYL